MPQSEQPLNILELLDEAEFPATVARLVDAAEDNDASEEALDQIRAMPDREYTSIHDVAMHMGQIEDLPGHENQWSSEPSDDIPKIKDNGSEILAGDKLGAGMHIVEEGRS